MGILVDGGNMRTVKTVIALIALTFLLVPEKAFASRGVCGFECNLDGFDFCIYTGAPNYACWQIQGGCISGGHSCSGGGM
jgi:hypothetical protein